MPRSDRTIAVALHDIEPATFARCALIRDWLDDHGVDRVTLLVIPARDLHPVGERSPEMVEWLLERRAMGDSIAQHGFQHERLQAPGWQRRVLSPARGVRSMRTAEFVGLNGRDTRRAVEAGWRLLKLAGIEPDGFVAPAYAYTPALRRTLSERYLWWASLFNLHGAIGSRATAAEPQTHQVTPDGYRWRRLAPACGMNVETRLGRVLSPPLVRAGATLAASTLRLDLHPRDLEHPRQIHALEWSLRHAARKRRAVTYDELAAGDPAVLDLPHMAGAPTLHAS